MPIVLYLCDRKACAVCNNPDCQHTSNIDHAKNFEHVHGSYWREIENNKEDNKSDNHHRRP